MHGKAARPSPVVFLAAAWRMGKMPHARGLFLGNARRYLTRLKLLAGHRERDADHGDEIEHGGARMGNLPAVAQACPILGDARWMRESPAGKCE